MLDHKTLGPVNGVMLWTPSPGVHTLALADSLGRPLDTATFRVRGAERNRFAGVGEIAYRLRSMTTAQPSSVVGRSGSPQIREILDRARDGARLGEADAIALIECPADELPALLAAAGTLRDRAKGRDVTYSRKVFLPVTNLCRDRCTYCTFRKDPGDPGAWTMTPAEIAEWSRRGRELGCSEALMCLGDKPELAFKEYRETLARAGRAQHDRVRRAGLRGRAGRGPAAAYQRRHHEPRRDGDAAAAQRQHGPDARKHLAAPAPTRRGASMGARTRIPRCGCG